MFLFIGNNIRLLIKREIINAINIHMETDLHKVFLSIIGCDKTLYIIPHY